MDSTTAIPLLTSDEVPRPARKTLIACYSLSGRTARLARELARRTGWDLEEISDLIPRRGRWGRLYSFLDLVFDRRPRIRTTGKDPSAYSMVVLAAPLWGESLASPMRSYIAEHRRAFKSIALACTHQGRATDPAARQAAAIAAKSLKATLALSAAELETDAYGVKLDTFLAELQPT